MIDAECPACSGSNTSTRRRFTHMLGLEGSGRTILQCNSCKLRYLWPKPTDLEIDELYREVYFSQENESKKSDAQPSLACDYMSESLPPRLNKFRQTLELILRKNPNARNILDIGAATGAFLSIAKEYDLTVQGVEASKYACEVAENVFGLKLINSTLEKMPVHYEFDLIHMNHVFEHFPNPNIILEKITSIATDGALIYVEVPYQFNIVERLKHRFLGRKKDYDLFSIHHPVFYTPKTLEKIFTQKGFEKLSLSVFSFDRYRSKRFMEKFKAVSWFLLSKFGIGNYIEAIFVYHKPV